MCIRDRSGELKSIIDYAVQAASADMSWKAIQRNSQDYIELKKAGVKFYKTPDAILRAQLAAWDKIIAQKGGENAPFKKALDLGFLDYSTLARRRGCCAEELRLNRRSAPDLYLDVVSVRGTPAAPTLEGQGPVIDVAVRMRTFAQEDLWDHLAQRGRLGARGAPGGVWLPGWGRSGAGWRSVKTPVSARTNGSSHGPGSFPWSTTSAAAHASSAVSTRRAP